MEMGDTITVPLGNVMMEEVDSDGGMEVGGGMDASEGGGKVNTAKSVDVNKLSSKSKST